MAENRTVQSSEGDENFSIECVISVVEALVDEVSDIAALRAIADEESTDEGPPRKASADHSTNGDSPEDSDSDSTNEPLLELIKLPAGVFVFSTKDISRLRLTHRIVGSLSGPLQGLPNHSRSAPPLQLRPEETRLLLERGIGTLVTPARESRVAPAEKLKALNEFDRRLHEVSNIERYRDKLQAVCSTQSRPKILKKRVPDLDQIAYQPKPFDQNDHFTVQLVDSPFSSTVPIPSESYIREISKSVDAELRYQVFRELWNQGNYVTGAANFGADFLVYRGDPSAYHAYACIKCMSEDSRVSSADLARYCRVSNAIKKNFVLASLVNHHVQYVTVTWEA